MTRFLLFFSGEDVIWCGHGYEQRRRAGTECEIKPAAHDRPNTAKMLKIPKIIMISIYRVNKRSRQGRADNI